MHLAHNHHRIRSKYSTVTLQRQRVPSHTLFEDQMTEPDIRTECEITNGH